MKPMMNVLSIALALSFPTAVQSAEMLANPREHSFNMSLYYSSGLSPTLVVSESVNVRSSIPLESGRGGFIFARLDLGDSVYVISCEEYTMGHLWVYVYIPELKEYGYVAAEFLQSNFNFICERTIQR
ncbi:hypothetical protein [Nodosilinea sp. E11]|uniref:hypothetical protein n=1 Tax=Nodosilinea sp. E11 TaxID=3037479 RepID=UPI0029344613|nr:hypothetical protein [Nodosilinea sp. E11]WOD36977.1 hypothetical protein RRF56_00480 [Nodosilinea sp. E11]